MRGPGDADFAGGICSQIPTGAIYSPSSGKTGTKMALLLPLLFLTSPPPPSHHNGTSRWGYLLRKNT
jgi:hypothetical protein